MDLYEALYTTRAMRRVKPDPVPIEVIKQMVDAAIRAPSGSNAQNWRMVAVTDHDQRTALGKLYGEAWELLQDQMYAGARQKAEAAGDEQMLRIMSSSAWLGEHFGEVPLVVLFFDRNDPSGGSIYPAVWSLQLAARGQGVGTTLTTILGFFRQDEVFQLLGVPAGKGWQLRAAVPCGYPLGNWGVAQRRPAHDVTFRDTWGEAPPWTIYEPMWDA
jgi:nitroreductase